MSEDDEYETCHALTMNGTLYVSQEMYDAIKSEVPQAAMRTEWLYGTLKIQVSPLLPMRVPKQRAAGGAR